jgi:oligopeptide transport system substrate-binding protein
MDDADALLAEYQRGDLDVIELPTDVLDAAQADPQLAAQLAVQPNLCTYYYGFNTRKPPFDDPTVRLAFSLAVDRQALIDDVVQGNQKPARWFSPPGLRAAPTAAEHPALGVTYEPEEARELLDQVYPDRSLMPPVTLAFTAFGQHEAIAAAVQAMWAENLDVQVELEPTEKFSDYLTLLKTDAPQIWRLGWCQDFADAHCFLSYLFHSDADYSNYTNWSSSAFDALAEQAAVSTDTAERAEWYAQAEDILVHQDAVVIPLYWYAKSALTQPYIHRTYSQIHGIERFEKWAVQEH